MAVGGLHPILGLDQDLEEYEKWGNMPLSIFVVDKTAVLVTQKLAFNICERSGYRYRGVGDGDSIERLLCEIVHASQNDLRDKDENDPGRVVTAREFLVKVTSVFPNIGIDEMNREQLDSVLSEIRKICSHKQFRTLDFPEHRELLDIIINQQMGGNDEIKQIVKAFIVALVYTVIFHNRIKIKKLIEIAQKWSLLDPEIVAALRENNRIRSEIGHVGGEGLSPKERVDFCRRYQEFVDKETEKCFKCQRSKRSDFMKLILTNQDILHVLKHYNRLCKSHRSQRDELRRLHDQLQAKVGEIIRLNEKCDSLCEFRGAQEEETERLRIRLQERGDEIAQLINDPPQLHGGQDDELETLRTQLQEKDDENARLINERDQLQTLQEDLNSNTVATANDVKRMTANITEYLERSQESKDEKERKDYIRSIRIELGNIEERVNQSHN